MKSLYKKQVDKHTEKPKEKTEVTVKYFKVNNPLAEESKKGGGKKDSAP